jgi:membrane protein
VAAVTEPPRTERPDTPVDVMRTLATNTVRDSIRDRVPGLAAEVAFYVVLSLPPLLLVVFGSLGFIADWLGAGFVADIREAVVEGAATFLSESTVTDFVAPAVDGLLEQGRLDILTIGAIVALWSASRATRVIFDAITIAYDRELRRTWWQRRLVAVGLTAAGIVSMIVLLPLLVAGPRTAAGVADDLGFGRLVETVIGIVYWPTVAVIGLVVLTWIYHLVEPETPWRWELPGAVLALTTWVAGSYALRLYATGFFATESAYRLVAAPLAVLLWVYVTAVAVLIGAELNGEVDKIFFADQEEAGDA